MGWARKGTPSLTVMMTLALIQLRKLAETARRRLSTDIHTATWLADVGLVKEFLEVCVSFFGFRI
jgi:hypothetical protein